MWSFGSGLLGFASFGLGGFATDDRACTSFHMLGESSYLLITTWDDHSDLGRDTHTAAAPTRTPARACAG